MVSILIPAFQSEAWICRALDSCKLQGEVVGEIIVVDDGSTDNTAQIIERWSSNTAYQVQLIRTENRGACHARNLAFSNSKFPWIQWLDADDELGHSKIETSLRCLEQEPQILTACKWKPTPPSPQEKLSSFDNRWGEVPERSSPADWLALDRHMVPHCYMGHRDLFAQAGPWDESLRINQDGEFFARVIAKSKGVLFQKGPHVLYRTSSKDSVSQFTPGKAESLFKSIESMAQTALSVETSPRMKQMIANRWQAFIYTSYPHRKDLNIRAQKKIKQLPTPSISNPNTVSKTSFMFAQLFGWKTLTHARLIRSKFSRST